MPDDVIDPQETASDPVNEQDDLDNLDDYQEEEESGEVPPGDGEGAAPSSAEVPPAELPQDAPSSSPAPRFTPPILAPVWTQDDHTRLVETFSNLDPEQMAGAVEQAIARGVQHVLQQSVVLNAPDDPIEAAVRHNLAVMGANDPSIYQNPHARQVAEVVAIQQIAQQTNRDPWEMLAEHAQKRTGKAAPAPPAPPPQVQQQRQAAQQTARTPPALRTPTPTVPAAQPSTGAARGTRDERMARALAADLGGTPEEYDVKGIRDSAQKESVRIGRR